MELIVNGMILTYMVHNCSIVMFKHCTPDIILLTSAQVTNNDATPFGIPNLAGSHTNSTGFS